MDLLCPTCREPLSVPEEYAGQLMRCPMCQGRLEIPASGPPGGSRPIPEEPAAPTPPPGPGTLAGAVPDLPEYGGPADAPLPGPPAPAELLAPSEASAGDPQPEPTLPSEVAAILADEQPAPPAPPTEATLPAQESAPPAPPIEITLPTQESAPPELPSPAEVSTGEEPAPPPTPVGPEEGKLDPVLLAQREAMFRREAEIPPLPEVPWNPDAPPPSPDEVAAMESGDTFVTPTWGQMAEAGKVGEADETFMAACPRCGTPMAVPRGMAGQLLRCPVCASGLAASPPGTPLAEGEAVLPAEPGEPGEPAPAPPPSSPVAIAVEEQSPAWVADQEQQAVVDEMNAAADRIREQAAQAQAQAQEEPAPPTVPVGEVEAQAETETVVPETPPEMGEESAQEGAPSPEALARREQRFLDVRRRGLEAEVAEREPVVEQMRERREARNQQRQQSAQMRLLRRLPGSGMAMSAIGLGRDIGEAAGWLGQEQESEGERRAADELAQIRQLLEQAVRDATNDGSSLAQRNRSESASPSPIETTRDRIVPEASGAAPAGAAPAEAGQGGQGQPGPMRPGQQVPGRAENLMNWATRILLFRGA